MWLTALILGILTGAAAREFYEFVIKRFFAFAKQKIKVWLPTRKK